MYLIEIILIFIYIYIYIYKDIYVTICSSYVKCFGRQVLSMLMYYYL